MFGLPVWLLAGSGFPIKIPYLPFEIAMPKSAEWDLKKIILLIL